MRDRKRARTLVLIVLVVFVLWSVSRIFQVRLEMNESNQGGVSPTAEPEQESGEAVEGGSDSQLEFWQWLAIGSGFFGALALFAAIARDSGNLSEWAGVLSLLFDPAVIGMIVAVILGFLSLVSRLLG